MLTDREARQIAAYWSEDPGSIFRPLADTGAIPPRLSDAIYMLATLLAEDGRDVSDLYNLLDYVLFHGERGPQWAPSRTENTITKGTE